MGELHAHQPASNSGPGRRGPGEEFGRISKDYEDLVRQLIRSQIDLDIIDEEALAAAEIRGGALHIADEAYRVVILPTLTSLGLPAGQALAKMSRAGGTVIAAGDLPTLADSISHTAALRELRSSSSVKAVVARILPPGELVDYLRCSQSCDLQLAEADEDLVYTHRVLEGRNLYFLANSSPRSVTIHPTFRIKGPYELFRPLTGQIISAGNCTELALDAYEGIFVVRPQ